MDMTFEERGQYITILATMHQKGRLSEKTIRFIVGFISDNLKSKFCIDEEGMWYNERLEIEMQKREKFIQSRRKNGSQGGRGKKKHQKASANLMGNLMGNENENENEDVNKDKMNKEFEEFWTLYDKKVGRDPCFKKWLRMTDEERAKAIDHAPRYAASTPDKQYRANPQTYLNQKRFLDEEIIQNGKEDKFAKQQQLKIQVDNDLRAAARSFYLAERTYEDADYKDLSASQDWL